MLVPRFEKRKEGGFGLVYWGIVDYERNRWFPYGGSGEQPIADKTYNPDWWERMRKMFCGPNLDETTLIEVG
jgi:hypothetical protein